MKTDTVLRAETSSEFERRNLTAAELYHEGRDMFWPPKGEVETVLYEIRNGRTKDYVLRCVSILLGMTPEAYEKAGLKDNCQMCEGERGGVPGNENIVNGVVMCDFCHADVLRAKPY